MNLIKQIAAVALAIGILSASERAEGADQYVKAGAAGSGASWADAGGSIQDAIDNAGTGDKIYVAGGAYFEAIVVDGETELFGGYEGASGAPGARDLVAYETIINASTAGDGGAPAFHAVTISEVTDTVLDGLTIMGGVANGSGLDIYGGGIYCDTLDSSNTISNCTISGNSANFGGGITCNYYAEPVIANCTISDNSSTVGGGGIYCRLYSYPALTDCTIENNSAGATGGGLRCFLAYPTLTTCVIEGNTAVDFGGGIFCDSSTPTLVSCTIGNNIANFGGGLHCYNGSDLSLMSCTISGNTANANGGGMVCFLSANPTITNCNFDNNSAGGYGGGVTCDFSSPTLVSCTISGNSAGLSGGGLECFDLGNATLTDCTISLNTADWGGGLYCEESNPTLIDCAIDDNAANFGGGVSLNDAHPILLDCTVTGNSASNNGGGLLCAFASNPTLTNCLIGGNVADGHGGGVTCDDANPTLTSCIIGGNRATLSGGGLECFDQSAPTLTNCTISGNYSADFGGGLYCDNSNPTLLNCTVSSNQSASGGGGIHCLNNSDPTLTNTIFSGSAHYAIYEDHTNSDPVVTNCLFYNSQDGDYFDENLSAYTGAAELNINVAEATSNASGAPMFVVNVTGSWSQTPSYDAGENRTTLVNTSASFTPGALVGRLINCDTTQRRETLIVANSATQLLVVGDVTAYAGNGDSYRLADHHLQNGSFALERAQAAGAPAADFEGDARPGADGLADIGADEADGAFSPPTDTTPPVSRVENAPVLAAAAVFNVPFVVGDNWSGVKNIRLYYRKDGVGAFQQYGGLYATSPISFDSSLTGGDGMYEFYTIATDMANVTESAPGATDDETLVRTSFIGSRIYVDADATGAQTGANWTDAFTKIEAAMILAEAVVGRETWVADGTYGEAITLPAGASLFGGFTGSETNLEQRDPLANLTTIDGSSARNGKPAFHVVTIEGNPSSTLDGFTITGGNASGSGNDRYGGGIFCLDLNQSSTIANCTVTNNAAEYGGGIYCLNGASPLFTSCTISGNLARLNGGGVVCFVSSHPTFLNCIISGNVAAGFGGGLTIDSSNPSLLACTISGNWAGMSGGGVECFNQADPLLTNCIISGNWADVDSGAMYCDDSDPTIINCTIADNGAGVALGGINVRLFSTPLITNTIFTGNTFHAIGETHVFADPTVVNCLFFANPHGDYFDENAFSYTGANDILTSVTKTSNIVDGNPAFLTGLGGRWSQAPSFDAIANRTTLTDSSAALIPGALVGRLINCDAGQRRQALIVANSETVIEVVGDVTGYAGNGDAYRLIDYHLGYGSGAIDLGADVGLFTDIEGNPRPIDILSYGAEGTGTEYDIGAYEAGDDIPSQQPLTAAKTWHLYF